MAGDSNARAIFISYRRDDSEGEAGRLYDDLVRAYSEDSVFMDVSGIQPGLDFRKAIDQNVTSCGVLLAMIGPGWANVTSADGTRRLDNPNDFVRLEIAAALARNVAVIPVLVHSAKMPALDQLPDDLKDLRYRNSVELTHARWNSDVALLVTALKSYVNVTKSQETKTVHATVPVQLPAPNPVPSDAAAQKSKLPLLIGIAAVLVFVAAGAAFWAMHARTGQSISIQPAQTHGAANSAPTNQASTNPLLAVPVTGSSLNASPASPVAPTSQPAQKAPPPSTTPVPDHVSGPSSKSGEQPAQQSPQQKAKKTAQQPDSQSSQDDIANAQPLPSMFGDLTPFLGDWKNSKQVKVAGELAAVTIASFKGHIMVHAWGKCEDHLCDWGTVKGIQKGPMVGTNFWSLGSTTPDSPVTRKASISMTISGDVMQITVHNVYTDSDGQNREVFTPLQFERKP